MQTYPTLYTDRFGTLNTVIYNDFDKLSMELDGLKFSGSEFTDFVLEAGQALTDAQRARFSFFEHTLFSETMQEKARVRALCDCTFHATVPQTLINKETLALIPIEMEVEYFVGKAREERGGIEDEHVKLSFTLGEEVFSGKSGYFEMAFDQIHAQFKDRYAFKNCYGCLYGDYSIYGSSSLGTLLCYEKQRERYLGAEDKEQYADLMAEQGFEMLQEIYCCDQYEMRKVGTGYRG